MHGQTLLYFIALFLIVVGALNWGYVSYSGSCQDDLVGAVFTNPDHIRWFYAAVGVSGVVLLLLILQRNAYNQRESIKDIIQGAVKSGKKGVSAIRKKF